MWSSEDEHAPGAAASGAVTRPDCPGCGAPDLAGDDFCHACGYSFDHLAAVGAVAGPDDAAEGPGCPVCPSGVLVSLEYGRVQCDACGYTVRDEL